MSDHFRFLMGGLMSSLLLPVAFHLAFNVVNTSLLQVTADMGAFTVFIILNWLVSLVIIHRLEPSREAVE